MNLTEWLPEGLSPVDFFAILAAFAAFTSVLLVWQALFVRDKLAPRLKALAARREQLREDLLTPSARRNRRPAQVSLMHTVVQKLNLARSREADSAAIKLARAGIRSRDAVIAFLFFKFCLPFAFGGFGLIWIYWLEAIELADPMKPVVCLGLVVLGAFAPGLWVKNQISKRKKALQKGLPDGLDLLVICAEAGLSLDAALTRVAREIGPSSPELADELGLTAVELSFLPERQKALENLNMRTDMASIRGVVNTLQQTEKYGTPLAQSLRVLSSEFRDERMLKAEEKAARLPALLTVPMIIFILPCLFVVLIGPGILRLIDNLSKF